MISCVIASAADRSAVASVVRGMRWTATASNVTRAYRAPASRSAIPVMSAFAPSSRVGGFGAPFSSVPDAVSSGQSSAAIELVVSTTK